MGETSFDEQITGKEGGGMVNVSKQDDYFKHADPHKDNLRRVEAGRLNPKNGDMIPLTSKGLSIMDKNLNPDPNYIKNFDGIKWDKDKKDGRREGYLVRTNARTWNV